MMSNFIVGDIITVIHPDWEFTGKQGKIVEIVDDGNEDGPIGVLFPEYYGRILDYPCKLGDTIRFEESDLEKNERDAKQDITSKQICDMLFGQGMWHTIYFIDNPLMICFTDCMHEGCDNKAVMRIMINCHGTVSEADVCKNHTDYHGNNCDGFPFKSQVGSSVVDSSKLLDLVKG